MRGLSRHSSAVRRTIVLYSGACRTRCATIDSLLEYWSASSNRWEQRRSLACHSPTSESDSTRNVTGPDGVESLDPGTPVGGRNLIRASHWQVSPLRSHLRHIGRVSSPGIPSENFPLEIGKREKARKDGFSLHFLRLRRQFRQPDRVRRRFWPVVTGASSDML